MKNRKLLLPALKSNIHTIFFKTFVINMLKNNLTAQQYGSVKNSDRISGEPWPEIQG